MLAYFYAMNIISGKITINDIPVFFREKVKEQLILAGAEELSE